MRLIGLLCVMGAGIALIGGLISGHLAPRRPRSRRRRDDSFIASLREDFPGFIPSAVVAAGLLVLGLLILMTWGR